MIGLWIALGILLFITFILFIRIHFLISFEGEAVVLKLKILGLPIKLMPEKDKKRKIRLSDYSYKSMEKKNKRKKIPKEKKEAVKKDKPNAENESLQDKIGIITEIVKYLIQKFLGHLRIDITRIRIEVGSEDAAKTAILFGIINQAAAALLDILQSITNVKKNKNNEIAVYADFTSERIKVNINIGLSVKVWHLFSIAFGTLFRYLGNMIKNKNKDGYKNGRN